MKLIKPHVTRRFLDRVRDTIRWQVAGRVRVETVHKVWEQVDGRVRIETVHKIWDVVGV